MVTEIVPANERVSADELEPTVHIQPKKHQLTKVKEISAEIATESDLIQWINDEVSIINTLTESVMDRKIRLGKVLAKVQDEMLYKRPGFVFWCESNLEVGMTFVYECLSLAGKMFPENENILSVHEDTPTYEEPEVMQPEPTDPDPEPIIQPKKEKTTIKYNQVVLRFTDDEWEELCNEAEEFDLTPAQYAKQKVFS
jgi:hypothetical protein